MSKIKIISTFFTIFVSLLFTSTAYAAISSGSVSGNAAADLIVGTTGADYNVSFNTNTASTAASILITFPAGYTITDGAIGTPTTAICSSGCTSTAAISIGSATTSVSGVTGSAAAKTVSIALTSAQNLSTGTTSFRLLLGIQNPTTAGLTGTFTASTSANGEVAQSGISGVTLTAATATQLVFTTQPANSTSGLALGTQPVVTARDQYGNTATSFVEIITFTEASAGTLTNNATSAVSGVATTTNLIYTASADQESFVLTASSSSLTATSSAVISNVVATKIIVATQPSSPGSGQQLSPQPVIHFANAQNTLDTLANSDTVTVSIQSGSGTLTGSTTKGAVNGVVTFTDLVYTTSNASESAVLRFTDNAGGTNNFNGAPVDATGFTSAVAGGSRDRTPPMILSFSPAISASSVATSTILEAEFHELIKPGYSGVITLRNANNGAAIATYSLSDANIEISWKFLRVRPATALLPGITYEVDLPQGIVLDQDNNAFVGMGSTKWQFTTVQAPTTTAITPIVATSTTPVAPQVVPVTPVIVDVPVVVPTQAPIVPPQQLFTLTLRKGMSGPEVRLLQEVLAKYPDIYPGGLITGYFGELTERAVERFQEKYQIASPSTSGYGLVGPKTRGQLNALMLQGQVSMSSLPIPQTTTSSAVMIFTMNLYRDVSHEEVRQLQLLLNRNPDMRITESGPGSAGSETTFFGELTERAVGRLQEKYNLAHPGDLGYGFVGPKTRAKLNEIAQQQ